MSGVMIYKKSINMEPLNVMGAQNHWEKIYTEKAPTAVSWYRPHLETSLELIERVAEDHSSSIIDVGGGESTLVDDLLARGYDDVTVLDISRTAIDANRKRLGDSSWASALASCRYHAKRLAAFPIRRLA